MTTSSSFVGGALSFKGDKKAKKKRSNQSKHKNTNTTDEPLPTATTTTAPEDDMTEAEKKALAKKQEREKQELELVAKKSHRERVEEFNEKLGSLTEHNDIPRVSIHCHEWRRRQRTRRRVLYTGCNGSLLTCFFISSCIMMIQVSAAGNG